MSDADEFTVVNTLDGMTGGADLTIDLEAATEGSAIVGGNKTEMFPGVGGGMENVVVAFCSGGGVVLKERQGGAGGGSGGEGDALVVVGELV